MDSQRRTSQNIFSATVLISWTYLRAQWRFFRWRRTLLNYLKAVESKQVRMKQTLLIVRHGQTTWNVEHRLPGQLPGVALNATGREQAERLAEALKVLPVSSIISSPLERALNTAEYIARIHSLEIYKEPALMDTNVGRWAGQTIEEVSKNDPDWKEYVKNPAVAPEGIETFPQVEQRVIAAVEQWLARDDIGAYPTFVAHADVVKLLLAHYMGLDASRAGTLHIDNASVSLVELDTEHKDQQPHIVAVGWTPKPGWLKVPTSEEKKPVQEQKSADTQQGQEAQEAGEQKS